MARAISSRRAETGSDSGKPMALTGLATGAERPREGDDIEPSCKNPRLFQSVRSAPMDLVFPHTFVPWFRSVAPYIHAHRGKTFVVAIAGELIAAGKLNTFA